MRLALLAPLPPEQNGIADYTARLRLALEQAGVLVIAPLWGQRPITNMADARAWVAERDWRGIDVVHAELGGGRHSEFLVLSALSELPDRPALSATVHDPERLIWKPVGKWWFAVDAMAGVPRLLKQALALLLDPVTLFAERRLAARLDGLVTLTHTGAQCLRQRMRLPEPKVRVIAHGVPIVAPRPLPCTVSDEQPPVTRLLYFGFIYSGKGIEDLIDALAVIKAQQPDVAAQLRLTIAGGTAPDIAFGAHGSYLSGLQARVQEAGLADQVEWDLDLDERDIAPLIQRHDVVVLPYRESRKLAWLGQMRGTSGALAWTVACGRGVLTSDARAFAEEIAQGNGRAYPQGDVAALAATLLAALNEPGTLAQWAQRASALAEQRAWPHTAQVFMAHFQNLSEWAQTTRGRQASVSTASLMDARS